VNKPTIFISYSHDSDAHRDQVLALSERLRDDGIETRLDRYLNGAPVEGWPRWMLNQLDEADFVLVVCTETYYRRFRGHEAPGKGKGVDWEGALITQELYDARSATLKFAPVLFSDDQQQFIPEPLRSTTHYLLTTEPGYQALYDFLLDQAGVEPGEVGELKRKPRPKGQPLKFGAQPDEPEPIVSISRLPVTGPDLFGREAELKLLDDAWADPSTNVIAFVAWGGVGKSALVNTWLARMAKEQYRSAERVYAWSFYSQGTSDERAASADLFIDSALRWFGDENPTAGSPWDKGERLANLIRRTRTLLVLDGLEPLQHPPGPQEGKLKDQALQALLRELAALQRGLCAVSTRVKISDLEGYTRSTVRQEDLDTLAPQAGAQILRAQGVQGEDEELRKASAEYGGHSLALTLLGSYLDDVYKGDIRRSGEIGPLEEDERHGGHARRVMVAYEKWLGEGPELAVLRLLGLFDRPAPADAIAVLRATPVIPGLTDALQNLSETRWQQTLAKLRRIKLLAAPSRNRPGALSTEDELDAHPLVREHFRQRLQLHSIDAWREANLRLYDHLIATTKELPDTVEKMSPLYAAVAHGCAAGRHQQALDDVFRQRILRGDEGFSVYKLGAFDADLVALAGFFETPWQRPVAEITKADQAFVLNAAGFRLRALGRLKDALEPMQVALQAHISQQAWSRASTVANNLSACYLLIASPSQALKFARHGVAFADRSGDEFWRVATRTSLADALHQISQLEEAEAIFLQAEEIQKQWQPAQPFLSALWGFRYCDLLLGQGKHQEVKERAAQTIEWAEGRLLNIALDNLSLGRACLLQSQQLGNGDYGRAAEFLQLAVDGLREARYLEFIPRGLLARAELRRVMGEYQRARVDLDEAIRIAERSQMSLHLADCHLEAARLCLAMGEREEARRAWATAKAMVERMGYHRRDGEVAALKEELERLKVI